MGSTNKTTHYELSQFVGTDKPAWLQDYNGDMEKIDAGIYGAKTAADNAQTAADNAQGDATDALSSIADINTELGTVEGTLDTAVGNINTINSLIGNGTPTTTDQTIIGAINELHSDEQANAGNITAVRNKIADSYMVRFAEAESTDSSTTVHYALLEARQVFNTKLAQLADNAIAEIYQIDVGGHGYFKPKRTAHYTNTDTLNNLDFGSEYTDANGCKIICGAISSTTPLLREVDIANDGTVTNVDKSGYSMSAGNHVVIKYNVYYKM